MSTQSFKVKSGLTLNPTDLSTLTSPQAGDLACDINDSNKIKRWDGANWVQVGSGGVGGLDFLFTQDFEEVTLADFTYVGLSLDTVSNLHGKVSAKLTHDASVNQYIKDVIAVEPKFRGKNHTIQLTVKSAASAGNVVLKITDETASTDLVVSEQLQLSNNAGGASSSVSFDIPETCLSLSYTITALPEAGSPVTIIDDIYCALTASNLFQSGVVQEEDSELYAAGNAGQAITASVTNIPFIAQSTFGDAILFDGSQIIIQKDGIYNISGSVIFTSSTTRSHVLYKNGVFLSAIGVANSVATCEINYMGLFASGDILTIRSTASATLSNDASFHRLFVTKQGSLKQVTVNSNQKITIPTSELRFEGASSRGTGTETAIVEFTSLAKLRGDAFAIDNSNGTAITMTKAGRVSISCALITNVANAGVQITKNQSVRTALASSTSELLRGMQTSNTSAVPLAWSGFLEIGDVIRIACTQAPIASTANSLDIDFQQQEVQVSVSNTLPQFSESDSCVRLDTANGYGSSGTKIRRFASTRTNIGNDILYTPSAVDGDSFVIQTSGIYSISYTDQGVAGTSCHIGIALNENDTITNVSTLVLASNNNILAYARRYDASADASNLTSHCGWTGYLQAGDVIRAHTNGVANVDVDQTKFTISKVGKPNVTGVDVTAFVNVPQPESQSAYLYTNTSFSSSNPVTGALTRSISSSIFSYNSSTGVYTVLKKGLFNLTYNNSAVGNSITAAVIILDGSAVAYNNTQSTATASNSAAYTEILLPGQQFYFRPSTNAANNHSISVTATALSDQILTQTETFSTDTASLTYAGSGAYTLSTLANAPVGTFITFTYAAGSNTRTQTVSTPPSQSTTDMNANGIQIFTRVYASPSSASQPSVVAIQIGKGLKGISTELYKSATKSISGSLQLTNNSAFTNQTGSADGVLYDSNTGILSIDVGLNIASTVTSNSFRFNDLTSQTSGYLVINASKNPALTGFGLNRIAARATSTAGGAIGTTATLQTFAEETFDTNGAWSGTTYVIPETGYYQVNCGISTAIVTIPTGGGFVMWIYKNGVAETTQRIIGNGAGNLYGCAVNDVLHFKKDDTVQIYASASTATTQNTAAGYNFISISKVSV